MNKTELIEAIAEQADLPKSKASAALDAFIGTVTAQLKKGKEPVTLVGFGTFEVKRTSARTGRNPATGEELKIPAKNSPKFKPGKALKDAVNKK